MDENFATVLNHLTRLLRQNFDARARQIGITRPQWHALGVIAGNEGLNQGALADYLEVEPITAGRMIDRMQEGGLVERRADPADRRAWRLFVTQKGERLLADLRPFALETVEIALDGLSDSRRAELMDMLKQIRGNLARAPQSVAING